MNLHYYYWYFPSVIPHRICDDIIEYGKSQQEEIALTGQTEQKEISEASGITEVTIRNRCVGLRKMLKN